jgi:hypothetical protein
LRTFGNITIQNNNGPANSAFLIGGGGNSGGNVTTGTVTISGVAGTGHGIDVANQAAGTTLSFGPTTITMTGPGHAVSLGTNSGTTGFSSLTTTTAAGRGIHANGSGTLNVTAGSLTQSGAGSGAASFTNTTLGVTLTSVSSTSGTNGLVFSGGGGSFTSATTNLQNNAGIGIQMSSSGVAASFGNTTVNSSAGDAVDISGQTAGVTFADLDLTPDSTFRGLDVQNSSGTITSTSGDIAATGAAAIFIDGPGGRTPLAMVLNNVDSTNGSADGLNLTEISGTFTVNDATKATDIDNSTGSGITVNNSTATVGFGNTEVTNTGNANGDDTGSGVFLTNNSGPVTFGTLTITPDGGERGLYATDSDATAAGAITIASGTITATSDTAIEITGQNSGNLTPINIQLTQVNASGGTAIGMILRNTSATGSPGGFRIVGAGSTAGSGGTIANITGGDGGSISAAPTEGTGMYMDKVSDVSLSNMIFGSSTGGQNLISHFAIRGNNVNNFTLRDSEFRGAFGSNVGLDEGAIRFGSQNIDTGLLGTALFEGNSIGGGIEDNLGVYVYSSNTLNLAIKDNATSGDPAVFSNTVQNSNDAFFLESGGTSTVTVNVTGVDFNGAKGDLLQVAALGSTQQTIIIQNNQFINNHSAIVSGGGGLTINGGGAAPNVDYLIDGNTFRGMRASAIFSSFGGHPTTNPNGQATSGGNISGLITNNTMGTPGTPGNPGNSTYDTSQAARGSMEGMFFFGGIDAKQLGSTGDVNYALRIEGNTIRDLNGQAGILLRSAQQDQNGQARVEATIKNNTMAEFGPGVFAGILGQPGGSALDDDKGTMGLDISNNNINFSVGGTQADAVYFDKVCLLATHYMPGYTSAPGAAPSTLAAFLTGPKGNTFINAAVSGGNGVGTNSTTSVANQAFVLTLPSSADPVHGVASDQSGILDDEPGVVRTLGDLGNLDSEASQPLGGAASIAPDGIFELGTGASSVVTMPTENIGKRPSITGTLVGLVELTQSLLAPAVHAQEPEGTGGEVTASIGTLAPGTSVTIYYDVKLDPVGTLPANVFQVSNDATISGTNFSTVTSSAAVTNVIQPEIIQKSFNPTAIFTTGNSTLTFTISNDNPPGPGADATAIAFTDTFPAGMTIADPATGNGCNGVLTNLADTAVAVGDTGIKYTGGSLVAAAGGTDCTITVKVKASQSGTYPNTTTPISSLQGAVGLASNTATLTVNLLTSAGVSVSGRVLTAEGRGVTNAKVTITGQDGVGRTATTGRGGAFNFDDVQVGSTYTVAVVSQRFTFQPKVIAVTDQVRDLDFTGQPR